MLKAFFFALAGLSLAKPCYDYGIPVDSIDSQVRFDTAPALLSSCPTTGSVSCHNRTVERNSCCFEAPGGLIMLVQFWDTNPPTGPSDHWTIHGLWPDNCDGSFESSCDPERFYHDLTGLLTEQGATDTLAFMEEYWVDLHGRNEQFWSHEWNKHGTCFSTLEPQCLPGRPKGADAVAFFQTVVSLFKTRPTYKLLEDEGIVPSSSRTYTRSEVISALRKGGGPAPVLDCKNGALNQISYYFNVKGSVIDGKFIATDPPTNGKCPTRFKYLPKERDE